MAKLNPYALRAIEPNAAETKSFTDPDQPGEVLVLTLRAIGTDPVLVGIAEDLKAKIVREWVIPPEGEEEPNALPLPNGRTVVMSETLADNLAWVHTMQAFDDDEDFYTWQELAAIAKGMPTAWNKATAWANSLNRKARRGNASREPRAQASSPASPSDSRTPSRSSTSQQPLAAPTTDSAASMSA